MADLVTTNYFFYGKEDELTRFKNEVLLKTDEEQEEMGCFIGCPENDATYEIIEKEIDSEIVKGIEAAYVSKWDSNATTILEYIDGKYDIKILYIVYSDESGFCYSNDINKNIWKGDLYVVCYDIFEDFMELEASLTRDEFSEKLKLIEKVMKTDDNEEWQEEWKEFIKENKDYELDDLLPEIQEYAFTKEGFFNVFEIERRDDDFENETNPNELEDFFKALSSGNEDCVDDDCVVIDCIEDLFKK